VRFNLENSVEPERYNKPHCLSPCVQTMDLAKVAAVPERGYGNGPPIAPEGLGFHPLRYRGS